MTSLELYSDDQGRQIHLLTTGDSGVLGVPKPVALLQLTSASGQRSKLNLKQTLRTAYKEVCVSRLLLQLSQWWPGQWSGIQKCLDSMTFLI